MTCPCKYDKKTKQYRDCKGKSCKPKQGQGLNELEKTGKEIKKFLKGLMGMKKGGSVIKGKSLRRSKTHKNK